VVYSNLLLGKITLSVSTFIYFIWLTPQIWRNFNRKTTEGLSLWMHGLLFFGYVCDLMYGFGRDMQWQYKLVTIIGLLHLLIQHYQFYYYGNLSYKQRVLHNSLSIFFVLAIVKVGVMMQFGWHNKFSDDTLGMLANMCWLSYMFPQIVKNHQNKSAIAVSIWFVLLGIFLTVLDSVSAWSFNWDYPSKVGPALALFGHVLLLMQILGVQFFCRNKKVPSSTTLYANDET